MTSHVSSGIRALPFFPLLKTSGCESESQVNTKLHKNPFSNMLFIYLSWQTASEAATGNTIFVLQLPLSSIVIMIWELKKAFLLFFLFKHEDFFQR
jgi:hypothetical protein